MRQLKRNAKNLSPSVLTHVTDSWHQREKYTSCHQNSWICWRARAEITTFLRLNFNSSSYFCMVTRRCSWSPSARSESGIWSLSPPSPANKRACCWVWISPTRRGACGLLQRCTVTRKAADWISVQLMISNDATSAIFYLFILFFLLAMFAAISAPSVWSCQCGATRRSTWMEMGKRINK